MDARRIAGLAAAVAHAELVRSADASVAPDTGWATILDRLSIATAEMSLALLFDLVGIDDTADIPLEGIARLATLSVAALLDVLPTPIFAADLDSRIILFVTAAVNIDFRTLLLVSLDEWVAIAAVLDSVLSKTVRGLGAVLDNLQVSALGTDEKMVLGAAVIVGDGALAVIVIEWATITSALHVLLGEAEGGRGALLGGLPNTAQTVVNTLLEGVVVAAVRANGAHVLVGNWGILSQREWDRRDKQRSMLEEPHYCGVLGGYR